MLLFALPARLERHWQASHSNRLHNLGVVTPDQKRSEMLILIIVLVLVFGLGGGYYGYGRWGTGGGAGIGLGTVLVILLVCYLLGLFR